MTCGGLCKDCLLGCPCRLQQCTHAPKQNLQDHKAANSILGHLRPRGHCLWTGTSALQPLSRWDSVRSKPRTWNQNSPVKAKSFCLNTRVFTSTENARKQFKGHRNVKTSIKVDEGHMQEQSVTSYFCRGLDVRKSINSIENLSYFRHVSPCSRRQCHLFNKNYRSAPRSLEVSN